MASPTHLKTLDQGVQVWNNWRERNPTIRPNLDSSDLSGRNLTNLNLSDTDLKMADLSNSKLTGADLSEADFNGANLIGANLSGAKLYHSVFFRADLSQADLTDADLSWAHLTTVDLSRANLKGAHLWFVELVDAVLIDTNFSGASLYWAKLGKLDLSCAKGLDSIKHRGPTSIGIDSIYLSKGSIPEVFLRGCGVPEDFITYTRSLTAQPIQFYSCFISYSSKDQDFADRLHDDLQAKGVRVWFAPHDMPIGARIRPTIDESIRVYDKLLLVLSEASVSSQWVEQEVETALAREREQGGQTVLFPVRIDDAVMKIKSGWPGLLKNTRNVGDFTNWKDHDSYQKAFGRLLRDLKAGA